MFLLTQVLLVLNVLGCIWFTNRVLDGRFYTLGYDWIMASGGSEDARVIDAKDGITMKAEILARIFPKRTSCTIKYMGGGGGSVTQNFYCVLAPNVLSQYIFLIIWFWYGFLLVVHSINMLSIVGMMCSSTNFRAMYLTRAAGSRKVSI